MPNDFIRCIPPNVRREKAKKQRKPNGFCRLLSQIYYYFFPKMSRVFLSLIYIHRGDCVLNAIWLTLMLTAIVGAILTGNTAAAAEALLNGGRETITFMLTLGGSMCLWSGLLRVAEKAGITRAFARLIAPLMRRLFPDLPQESAACHAMSMNIAANVLGLGNAATPLGLQAMKHLREAAPHTPRATRNMVVFAVLNTASLQLLPTTVAALRAEAGSAAPFAILPAVWLCSLGSVMAAVTVARVFEKG